MEPWKKNTPVSKKGEKYKWADNPSIRAIANRPFQLGVVTPQYLTLTLRSIFGNNNVFNREFSGQPQWNNSDWIKRQNDWWVQIIARTLKKDPDESNKRATRQLWSEREKANIARLARRLSREGATRIGQKEIETIADNHNSHWAGTYTRTGEKIVYAPTDKPLKRKNKEYFTKDVLFSERTAQSIRGMMKKWPDTKHLMDRALPASQDEDGEEDGSGFEDGGEGGVEITLRKTSWDKKPGIDLRPKREDDDEEDMDGMSGVSDGSGGHVPFAHIDAAIAALIA